MPVYIFLFLRKDFERTKTQIKQKSTIKNKQTKNNKGNYFLDAQ